MDGVPVYDLNFTFHLDYSVRHTHLVRRYRFVAPYNEATVDTTQAFGYGKQPSEEEGSQKDENEYFSDHASVRNYEGRTIFVWVVLDEGVNVRSEVSG